MFRRSLRLMLPLASWQDMENKISSTRTSVSFHKIWIGCLVDAIVSTEGIAESKSVADRRSVSLMLGKYFVRESSGDADTARKAKRCKVCS